MIDELAEGETRRLLRSARTDAPPPRLVAAAIALASKSADAATADSSSPRKSTPKVGRRNISLVAGALVVGAVVLWAGARELRSENPASRSPAALPAPTSLVTETPPSEPTVRGTSVAELPDAPEPHPSFVASSRAAPRTAPKPSNDASDLLLEANRLRARGRWSEAAATYQRVIDLAPDSADAYPADVALGNLDLQQNRPLAALARFEHALASHPGGALAEEARWGKARALRAAGRLAEERAALQTFKTLHPDSPLVPAANQRLAEIGE
jgi:hypothetical protein